tara:strand:+ start:48 stop:962 length:915 start_codon:yes stop_codon:yes gene_type:complete
MLSHLFDAVLPIFAIGALGYFFGKKKIFDNQSAFVINKFVMLVSMPALCIHFLAKISIENFDLKLLVGYLLSEIVIFMAALFLAKLVFQKSTTEALLIGLAITLTNHVLFVLPIAQEIFGDDNVTTIISIISMDGLVIFSLTIIVMDSITNRKGTIFFTLKKIVTNPPLIGIALGFFISLSKIKVSSGLMFFLDQLGSTASPALLFSLGVILSKEEFKKSKKLVGLLTFIKLIVHPLIAWCFIHLLFGNFPIEHKSALIVAAAPCGVMAFMLAMNYKVPVTVIASIIFYTSIGSLFTISFIAGL